MPFTGNYRHTIDSKGRLIVPSRLRDELQNDQVVLTVWADNCISMWSGENWEKLQSQLLQQPRTDPKKRAAVRRMGAHAHADQVDKQGRITVPEHLRKYAGITKDCVVVGVFDHGEIWSSERYDQELDAQETEEGSFDEEFNELDL